MGATAQWPRRLGTDAEPDLLGGAHRFHVTVSLGPRPFKSFLPDVGMHDDPAAGRETPYPRPHRAGGPPTARSLQPSGTATTSTPATQPPRRCSTPSADTTSLLARGIRATKPGTDPCLQPVRPTRAGSEPSPKIRTSRRRLRAMRSHVGRSSTVIPCRHTMLPPATMLTSALSRILVVSFLN